MNKSLDINKIKYNQVQPTSNFLDNYLDKLNNNGQSGQENMDIHLKK